MVLFFSPEFGKYMSSWSLEDLGFDYRIISILGSQSTGKSKYIYCEFLIIVGTLLNKVFNTNFKVMNESIREQTTEGIWFSKLPENNIIIVDVEGTDGRERGENKVRWAVLRHANNFKEFERRSSLFSLAISDVLIVNLWEHQIGLYNGSNINLLKTVFDVNLHMFKREKNAPRSQLIFTIRDTVNLNNIANISECLVKQLEDLWTGLVKPQGYEDSKFQDFFEMEFYGLPHMIYKPNEFNERIKELSKRLCDKSSPDYFFNKVPSRKIPADGLPAYIEQIWGIIEKNKDLDMPSQNEMLALFRCDEIIQKILSSYPEKTNFIEERLSNRIQVQDFSSKIESLRDEMLSEFDKLAFRYSENVYKSKRKLLNDEIADKMHELYRQQIMIFLDESTSRLSDMLLEMIKNKDKLVLFIDKSRKSLEYESYLFDQISESNKLKDSNWDSKKEKDALVAKLNDIYAEFLEKEINIIIEKSAEECVSSVENKFVSLLDNRSVSIWDDLIQEFTQNFDARYQILQGDLTKCKEHISAEKQKSALEQFSMESLNQLMKLAKCELEDVKFADRVHNFFIHEFMYDSKDNTRTFYVKEEVDNAYLKAKSSCESYARLLSRIEVPKSKFPTQIANHPDFNLKLLTVIPRGKLASLIRHVGYICEGKFTDAKVKVVNYRRKVPIWAIAAIVILGWNEMLAVLRNPLYLFCAILISILGYAGWCIWNSDSILSVILKRFPQATPCPIITESSQPKREESQTKKAEDDISLLGRAFEDCD